MMCFSLSAQTSLQKGKNNQQVEICLKESLYFILPMVDRVGKYRHEDETVKNVSILKVNKVTNFYF